MADYGCVVFDLDDTLYLECDYVASGFAEVGKWAKDTLGLATFERDAWGRFTRGARGDIFNLVLSSSGIEVTPKLVQEMVGVYRKHRPQISLQEDSAEAIRARPENVTFGLITDGYAEVQALKVAALDLEKDIESIVISDRFGRDSWKPSPVPYAEIERLTGLPGRRCVYLGDNPAKDFVSARARGWGTVRVRRSKSLHAEVPSGDDVDCEVQNLSNIWPLLQKLND